MYWSDDYDYYALNWLEARCMGDYEADGKQCYEHYEEDEEEEE